MDLEGSERRRRPRLKAGSEGMYEINNEREQAQGPEGRQGKERKCKRLLKVAINGMPHDW